MNITILQSNDIFVMPVSKLPKEAPLFLRSAALSSVWTVQAGVEARIREAEKQSWPCA
jgi:hypothetical protein